MNENTNTDFKPQNRFYSSEITWTIRLLEELGITKLRLVTLHWDNQSAFNIAHNLIYMIKQNTLRTTAILLEKRSWKVSYYFYICPRHLN